MLVAAAVFTQWPEVDLAVSGMFYSSADGFALDRSAFLSGLRWGIWYLCLGGAVLGLAGLLAGLFRKRLGSLGPRLWGFVFLLFALGPGVLVNGLLKSHWGRARPADVTVFGGAHAFTPALFPADQCASNCSFVSGEGSASVALMISALVVLTALGDRLSPRVRRVSAIGAVFVGLLGSALRLATGRHFLSDTVFAALFVAAVALVLYRVIRPLAVT